VTIIQMDAELDHGPILWQEPIPLTTPILGRELDNVAGKMCGDLLVHVMQELPKSTITPIEQNHAEATFCTKITKDMAELTLNPTELPAGEEALAVFRKICAFDGWPSTFFFHEGKRIKITDATYDPISQSLSITKIIPEGKKEMPFEQYFR
jgi:methionyl-tRNA formyltransferase